MKNRYNFDMRKLLIIFCLLIIFSNRVMAMIDVATGEEIKGYKGTLPDVTQRFEPFRTKISKPKYEDKSGFDVPRGFKEAPLDNPDYLDVMIRKERTSAYAVDVKELIRIVETIITSIEKGENEQKFSAKVNSLNNNVDYFRDKYEGRPESYYPSFDSIIEVNAQAKNLLILRSESKLQSPYMPYTGEGAVFSPQNINKQTQYLLEDLKRVLRILKDVN